MTSNLDWNPRLPFFPNLDNGPSENLLELEIQNLKHKKNGVYVLLKPVQQSNTMQIIQPFGRASVLDAIHTQNKPNTFTYKINNKGTLDVCISEHSKYKGIYMFFVRFIKVLFVNGMIKYTHKFNKEVIEKLFKIDDDTWHLIQYYSITDRLSNNYFELTVTVSPFNSQDYSRPTPCASLHDDTILTDFEMRGKDGSVHMYKAIAAASSSVLRTMFSGEWRETSEGVVHVPEITQVTLHHFKDYIYLDVIPKTGLEQLLLLASYYKMPELERRCINALLLSLTAENTQSMVEFAVKQNMQQLLQDVLQFTRNGFVSNSFPENNSLNIKLF